MFASRTLFGGRCFACGFGAVPRKDVLEGELAFCGLPRCSWDCEGGAGAGAVVVVELRVGEGCELDVGVEGLVRCVL
jgi:hypothetical protein